MSNDERKQGFTVETTGMRITSYSDDNYKHEITPDGVLVIIKRAVRGENHKVIEMEQVTEAYGIGGWLHLRTGVKVSPNAR